MFNSIMLGLLGNVLYACHTCNAYIVCVSAWKDVAITSYIIFMYCTFIAIITNLVCTWLAVKTESLNVCAIYKLSDC